MIYLLIMIGYVAVGCLQAFFLWKEMFSNAPTEHKENQLYFCLTFIAPIWPYWLFIILLTFLGEIIEEIITQDDAIYSFIPLFLSLEILMDIYEKKWKVKLLPDNEKALNECWKRKK